MTITFNNLNSKSVAENTTGLVLNVQAILGTGNADDGLTYSITGANDDGLFTIDSLSGELSFINSPNFENPKDGGSDNDYLLTVTATDGGSNTDSQNITITVTNRIAEKQINGYKSAYELSNINGDNGFIINGVDSVSYSGRSVSDAGDVNGDGYADVIIGAYAANGNAGESYVVFGSAGGFDKTFELSNLDGSDGFTLNGNADGDRSGFAVSGAGDVNGDGYDDLIIGAFVASPNSRPQAGESYVVFGFDNGSVSTIELSSLTGTDGFRLEGQDNSDQSGRSVANAGDVNGDGYDDIIVSAYRAHPNGIGDAGETYVVFGASGGFAPSINLSSIDGPDGFVLNGIYSNDLSGVSVSGARDINGDGYDDVIIGAPFAHNSNSDNLAGQSYVVFGFDDGAVSAIELSSLDGSDGFIIEANDSSQESGFSVSEAGDVNGDGYDDFIIGARLGDVIVNSDEGKSFVVFGQGSPYVSILGLSSLDGGNGFVLNGIANNDYSGFSVSAAGDVNGDGYGDLIIGAPFVDLDGNNDYGESYLVFGFDNETISTIELSNLNGSNGFQLLGSDSYDFSGISVSAAGDINGDGYSDLIIGAYGGDPNGLSLAGESYIIFGGDKLFPKLNITYDHSTQLTADLPLELTTPTPFDDYLEYGRDEDVLSALPGHDYVDGGLGNDTIGGNTGNDTIEGGLGADLLFGWLGDDLIFVGLESISFTDHSHNVVWAGPGYDTVVGDAGSDILGGGHDDDHVTGGRGDDLLFGGFGNDTVSGDQGFDTIYGGWGDDLIKGGAHADLLFNGEGDDTVQGGSGNDTLWGGRDNDQLNGGIGSDKFVFTVTAGNDQITDFNLDDDMLDLSATDFTGLDTLTSAAEDTSGGLLVTINDTTTILFMGLSLSDLANMDITFAS